ncbi:MAG: type II secretion system minor pseudopilin GspK [Betaproteobacteria bacterium]|nr:type II secretion system minor pseudopilin GspK [Betaproteobacteria bacterium]
MNKQKGVAVIMAMLIVALATTVASALIWEQNLWLREVESESSLAQAKAIALAGTNVAAAILNSDARNIDDFQGAWAQPLPPLPVETGEISGFIQDQQGLFNLNNLVNHGKTDQDQKANFERLLAILDIPANLGDSLADWIDHDHDIQGSGGAENAYYLGLHPPYRAANRMLTEVGELSRIRGFNKIFIERLRPFVTALPRPTRINVNTAPAEVLSAMVDGMTLPEARTLTAQRDQNPFSSMSDFRAALPRIDLSVTDGNFSVSSHFFLVTVNTHFGRASFTLWTLLDREGNLWPSTVWQKSS